MGTMHLTPAPDSPTHWDRLEERIRTEIDSALLMTDTGERAHIGSGSAYNIARIIVDGLRHLPTPKEPSNV